MRNNVTYRDLVACARRVGVTVAEAPSSHRGKKGTMGSVVGVVEHHTGTANSFRPGSDYPDFNVVKEGRAGLANSLSAFGIGRYDAIYVFSEYLSWHAGKWSYRGFTDGNGDFLGIECAGVGDYTPFQRAVYPRLVASLLLFLNAGVEMAPRHADGAMPRGRKTDAAGFSTTQFYRGANFYDSVKYFIEHPEYINVNYQPPAPTVTVVEPVEEEDMERLIFALYRKYLGREPNQPEHDLGDVDNWLVLAADASWTAAELHDVFITSRVERGTVIRFYSDYLGREPTDEEIDMWLHANKSILDARTEISQSAEAKARK